MEDSSWRGRDRAGDDLPWSWRTVSRRQPACLPGAIGFRGSSVWRAELSSEGGDVVGKRQLLPDSSFDYAPRPSPDGRQIVFESVRSGPDQIWKSNADGSDLRKLTSLSGNAGAPQWSADGKWIAFDYLPENQNHRQIFAMDAEGRNLHMVVSGNYNTGVPSFSHDGKAVYLLPTARAVFRSGGMILQRAGRRN